MGVRLVVTDLDGTLWGRSLSVHPSTRRAMDELHTRGIPVLAATARRRASVRYAAELHGVRLGGVMIDGALGYEDLDGAPFHDEPLIDAQRRAIVGTFADAGQEPVFETDNEDVHAVIGARPSIPSAFLQHNPTLRCDLTGDLPWAVYSAVAVIPVDLADDLLATVTATGACAGWLDRNPDFPETVTIKVRSPFCSKWSTVVRYCQQVSIDPQDVLAIGNDDNDIELLSHAGTGLAVSTASPAALAAASGRVGDPDRGGWAELLEHL